MEKITYNPDLFALVKDLVSIDNNVIFMKENNKVVLRRTDAAVSISYSIKAPLDYFNFPENVSEVAFVNFSEFYQYLKTFNKPDIFLDNQKITLKENNSKVDYILSDSETFVRKSPKEPNFGTGTIQFNFTHEDHDEILKRMALIKPKKIKIFGNSTAINIKISETACLNSFEKQFKVINNTNTSEEVDMVIFADTFMHMPSKRDYVFEIRDSLALKISLIDEKLNLDIYTAKLKD